MKITATEEYGMRCMMHLALRPEATVSITDLAAAERIAVPFAAKVLLGLRRAGLVLATRGRHGGYRLAAEPKTITVARILRALGKPLFDGAYCQQHTPAQEASCARLANCSLRPVWAHLDRLLFAFFEHTTLADLAEGEKESNRHLRKSWPLVVPAGWQRPNSPRETGESHHAVNR
jgi:Rrf2 family transcriptional regulator, iron-sulfur cluster assembly transcription factor